MVRRRRSSSPDQGFAHEDIRLAQPIGVGNHSYDDVAQLLIELEWVVSQVSYPRHVVPDLRKEIDSGERRLIILVIRAKRDRQPATLSYLFLQISYQCA